MPSHAPQGALGHLARAPIRGEKRESSRDPSLGAPLEVFCLEAPGLQHERSQLAAVSALADDDDRSLGIEPALLLPSHDLRQRDVHGTVDVAGVPLVWLADVKDLDLALLLIELAGIVQLA